MIARRRTVRWILSAGLFLSGGCSSSDDPTSVPPALAIGDSHEGGRIFYLDETGEHGLVAAAADQGSSVHWFDGSYVVTGATGTELAIGQANTAPVVSAQGSGSYAAILCDQLVLKGFSDWFLPSKDELNVLFVRRAEVGGFTNGFYWSSTEHGEGSAWEQAFNTGTQYYANKNFPIRIRAIRAF